MKATVVRAMLVSTVLVAPLIYLQLRFGYSDFPFVLFAVLWLLPGAFVLAAVPLLRAVRAGESLLARRGALVARVGFLVLTAMVWAGIVDDQMPCFLGVPNCD